MTQHEILEKLKEGNLRFVNDKLKEDITNLKQRSTLAHAQTPHTIILSCADSRVIPELVFDCGMGELFVVRVAGNIANTSSVASLEYAIENLGSKLIIVMGHQNCGAVTAAVEGGDYGKNLNHLLEHIQPAIELSDTNATVNDVVKKNAEHTKSNLLSKSDIINKAYLSETIDIIPAYYCLETGKVSFL